MFNMVPFRSNNQVTPRDNFGIFNPFSDDFFRSFFGNDSMLSMERPLKVDVRDEGDHFLLEADMPGISRDNVHVHVDNGILTISTEYDNTDEKEEKGKYIYRERRCGKMSRSFNLDGIKAEDITAKFQDGILKLTMPKLVEVEKNTTRAIEIE